MKFRLAEPKTWAVIFLLLLSTPVFADELKPGYLEINQETAERWHLIWKAPNKGDLTDAVKPYIPGPCHSVDHHSEATGVGVLTTETLQCSSPLTGESVGLLGLESTVSDVLVRIAPLNSPVQTARLTPGAPLVEIQRQPNRLDVVHTYGLLGVEHILTGYDHLLFVLTLVLLLQQGWRVAAAVTSFTLAHSITLVATTLGFLGVPRAPIESCIALSIIFLAVEVIKSGSGPPRWSARYPGGIAFVFGLLHGFGFAGALAEIGLPPSEIPASLFSFNLGVEIGQLVIVAGALMSLALIHHFWFRAKMLVIKLVTYAIGAISSGWLFERMMS